MLLCNQYKHKFGSIIDKFELIQIMLAKCDSILVLLVTWGSWNQINTIDICENWTNLDNTWQIRSNNGDVSNLKQLTLFHMWKFQLYNWHHCHQWVQQRLQQLYRSNKSVCYLVICVCILNRIFSCADAHNMIW